ncbi:MAG: hypothetical protein U1A78_06035 [Polyangia bacterium]
MGLFDKKRPHDEPAASSGRTPVHAVEGNEPSAPEAKIVIEMVAPPTGAVRVGPLGGSAKPPGAAGEPPRYTIQQAIELWRSLPEGSSELVGQVVKRTLESMNIRVETIVQDAVRKQVDLQGRINRLSKELLDLEHELTQRRAELLQLEVEYRETTLVKERLVQADRTEAHPGRGDGRGDEPRGGEGAQVAGPGPVPPVAPLPKLSPGLASVLSKAASIMTPRGGK